MRRAVLFGAFLFALSVQANAQTGPAAPGGAMSPAEIRELLDAAKATAKASRENVDYIRVVPDILYQVLAKLDKVETKLDKIENELKAARGSVAKKR
ncbi:hypothetical protein [Microvirga brassicacearum]|uniref:Uncharacterized protein n=1 Tax=Microvirga brassicacearum TaxID=2580413 RepID=A0A5N3P6Q1_9HYPH|nr:hypothetical protein [Microvirga brassicacearum]KAB0265351.1 hypothetical protein FEZ63_18670 [Microvirga brassicacearum]